MTSVVLPDPAAKVAIVGMAVLLPGAPNLDQYWRNLLGGVDSVTEVPADRWDEEFYQPGAGDRARPDRIYCRRGGFVEPEVDLSPFGIMPNSVGDIDPDQLIALRVAADALADAGGAGVLPADRSRVGVVLGRGGYLTTGMVRLDQQVRTANQLVRTLSELLPDLPPEQLGQVKAAFEAQLRPAAPDGAIGLVPNLAASRIANRLDLRGPAYTVDAACASSLVAVDHAVAALASGRCDLMLAGGVHHCHDVTLWSVFSQLGALSPSQQIRPFDRRADGVLIAEGTGVVVLKRLADAQRDGDRVYAVVAGTGVASDGRTGSLFNPDSQGQVRAVEQAWAAAGLDPAAPGSVGLVEAHGTGTVAGDTAELATLEKVFGAADPAQPGPKPVIGSVKSMIGHAMPAAGVAGLVKAALAVYHRTLLPTLHCEQPHPALARSRFAPIGAAAPWPLPAGQAARRAAVNAFGFGGINAHVIVEEAPQRAAPRTFGRVLRVAAGSVEELARALAAPDADLAAAVGGVLGAGPVRLAVDDPTPKRLALARKAVARGTAWRGRSNIWFTPSPLLGAGGGKVAMVFPGLEADFDPDIEALAEQLGTTAGVGLAARVGHVGSHGAAVFRLGRVLHRALAARGVRADGLAGHSVGEWTAMERGGIFDEAEIDAFLDRFDPDSVSVPGVEFAVVGAPADDVQAVLAGWPGVVLSHDNAPNQSMVCGPAEAVAGVVAHFRAAGVISQQLPFRSGFHTPMFAPYLGPIESAFDAMRIAPATTEVWSATTASPFPADPAQVRELYFRHLVQTVRFRETVSAMHDAGYRVFLQLGIGQVGALVGDILGKREHLAVAAHSGQAGAVEQLDRVLAALWVEGHGEPAAAQAGRPVRLDMGGALVRIAPQPRAELAAGLRARLGGGPAAAPLQFESPQFAAPALAGGAWAPEFSAFVADTQRMAHELVAAAATPRTLPPPPQPALPVLPPRGPVQAPLEVSLEAMPYLVDHAFFKLPPGWPDQEDRWPVVPATTLVAFLVDFAAAQAPGQVPVAVADARFEKWLPVVPSSTVTLTAAWEEPSGVVAAAVRGHARARVELAAGYPARSPAPWVFDPAAERVPGMRAEELYTRRWLFHGPQFQGVTALTAIGPTHVRGQLTAPAAPGALLDNVGQLLGYWVMATLPERATVFPVGMDRVEFFGPHPGPGEVLDCDIVLREVTDTDLTADVQLRAGGRVWAQIAGWRDRRFDSTPVTKASDAEPEHNTLSTLRPEGWAEVTEMWPDLATRELLTRKILGRQERAEYAAVPPRRKRQWLLGRVAAKDAVRQYLWRDNPDGVYPHELRVGNAPSGAPTVAGTHGKVLPRLSLSLAHCQEMGVAIARRGPCGIDVEELVERDGAAELAALGAAERALLDRLAADGGRALWFTRFWTAKEAVAKAWGTGLQGAPQRFAVTAAEPAGQGRAVLTVAVDGVAHTVRTCVTANPPPLPPRDYVVAWTGPEDIAREVGTR